MQLQDYYQTLDVGMSASAHDIRRSFRKLAHKYHPDISKQSNCEQMFKEITETYAAVKSSKKYSAHDLWLKPAKHLEFENRKY
ncbi:MAG: DnaJ domain-containing protein [Oleibacter sp.]|nr:DnaJ domain-containing protein [Thalassolituus sp.]